MAYLFAQKYKLVHQEDSTEHLETEELNSTRATATLAESLWHITFRRVPWVFVTVLLMTNFITWTRIEKGEKVSTYSPAQSAVKHKTIVFQAGIDDDLSAYQGYPNGENDRNWEELYRYGVSKISMSEAKQLANPTSPIPEEPGQYMVILEIFHQLHCLDHLRKRIFWNSSVPVDSVEGMGMVHMDHCIDSIRQSLMCSADVTPLPYGWWTKLQRVLPIAASQHTCRDFNAIWEWSKENHAAPMDLSIQVENPLGNVVFPKED